MLVTSRKGRISRDIIPRLLAIVAGVLEEFCPHIFRASAAHIFRASAASKVADCRDPEMSINIYQSSRRHVPRDLHRHQHSCKNLKSSIMNHKFPSLPFSPSSALFSRHFDFSIQFYHVLTHHNYYYTPPPFISFASYIVFYSPSSDVPSNVFLLLVFAFYSIRLYCFIHHFAHRMQKMA
jgi:hypothetical protein